MLLMSWVSVPTSGLMMDTPGLVSSPALSGSGAPGRLYSRHLLKQTVCHLLYLEIGERRISFLNIIHNNIFVVSYLS